jgi:catechol 2,3-dioxygenase-like lactoylglutathione lyase family enzyme
MDGAEALAREFERVHGGDAEGEARHGPSLRTLVAGLDARSAAARPLGGGHGAAEILEHVAAWRDYGTAALEGRREVPPEDGWRRVDALSPAEWDALRARLEESVRRLAAAVRAASPEVLAAKSDTLRFVLHHDLYHAGQVGLLRRAPAAPRTGARLYRVILPVGDVEGAARFYGALLGAPGKRVSAGRHDFDCEGTVLACYDPVADGDEGPARPNMEPVYLAVDDLEAARARAEAARALFSTEPRPGVGAMGSIALRPWGERSFYASDPWGNPFCFVARDTVFTG